MAKRFCLSFYFPSIQHSTPRFIVCRKSPISSATRHLAALPVVVAGSDHCTAWPARFVVAVSGSKNKWRDERHSSLLPLHENTASLFPLRLPSGESALIWLNVAQSWQFAPSESQTTSPSSSSSRSLLFLHPNILPAAVFVSFVSLSHSFAVPPGP